jgi:hypothetical protein
LAFVAPFQRIVGQHPAIQVAQDPLSTTVYITKSGKGRVPIPNAEQNQDNFEGGQGERVHTMQGVPPTSIVETAFSVALAVVPIARDL